MKKVISAAAVSLGALLALHVTSARADNMKLTGEVMQQGDEYMLSADGKTYMLEPNDSQKMQLMKLNHKMATVNGDVSADNKVMVSSVMMAHMMTGTVMSKDGEYMLSVKGKEYMLKASDDQKSQLADLDQKMATVTGEMHGKTIMVDSVKMAAH